jgi:hypothetical protein
VGGRLNLGGEMSPDEVFMVAAIVAALVAALLGVYLLFH